MQFRQLEYIAALVQWKTMRKAAQALYVSEATMSQQIRALETEIGFVLFERNGRYLHLSPEGEKLLPGLHMLLHARQEFEQNITEIKNPAAGRLRLGIGPGLAKMLLPDIFQRFRAIYPQIHLDVYEGGMYQTVERADNHLVDLALFPISHFKPLAGKALTIQPLGKTEGVLLVSQHHRLAHKENISKVQLISSGLISYSDEFIINDLFSTVIGPEWKMNSVSSVNNLEVSLSLAQTGMGIAFAPGYLVKARQIETQFRHLKVLDLAPEIRFPLQHVYAYAQRNRPSEPLETLIEIIKSCYPQVLAGFVR